MMTMTTVPETWSVAVDDVVAELLKRAQMTKPPVDALALATRLEILGAFDHTQYSRGRHKVLAGQSSIFLKPDERPERLQWAAAHELGEVIAWQVFEHLRNPDEEISPPQREDVANLFASRLMLPSQWFFDDVRRLHADILALKHFYRTASHELIAYRLLDLPEPTIITVFDHGRLTRRRSNLHERFPRLQAVERDCWSEVRRQNRPVEIHQHGLTVQGWPIHETTWKREILRTAAACESDDFDVD